MLRRALRLLKGDYCHVFIHDGNPQTGAPYNEHDRKMKDEEFEDFLKSVRGWTQLPSGAIEKRFVFDTPRFAYDWMGRVMGFCYLSDKYGKITWFGNVVDVTIYSARFHGLSMREARLAAFMNDQANLIKRADQQRDVLLRRNQVAPAAKAISGMDTQQPPSASADGPRLPQLKDL